MASADELTDAEVLRLKRYMTPAGYDAAFALYGSRGFRDAISEYSDNLLLAAAALLDGIPVTPSEAGSGLSSFKLDVLEFKFRDTAATQINWRDIATRLRQQAAASTSCGVSANPSPNLDGWGIG